MSSEAVLEVGVEIGRGPFTRVYRGYDRTLGQKVAIKELDSHTLGQDLLEQCLDGARQQSYLSHPHLVQVYCVEPQPGWIVMELMRGNLATVLTKEALRPEVVRGVLRQALSALAYLHEQGFVHGQIQPSNLLVGAQGQVKLGDFGCHPATGPGLPNDQGKYLAPERLSDEFGPVGPAIDLYSLGFSCLELLLGPTFDLRFPGVGPDVTQANLGWMRWHRSASEILPPLTEWVPDLPNDLLLVLTRLLEKRVEARYASAAAALADVAPGPDPVIVVPKEEPLPISLPPAGSAVAAPSYPGQAGVSPEDDATLTTGWRKLLDHPAIAYPCSGALILATLWYVLGGFQGGSPSGDVAAISLAIESTPAGATVLIDDEEQTERTNATLSLLAGSHRVRVKLDGYETAEQTIELVAGQASAPLHFELQRTPPLQRDEQLVVRVEPATARVRVDGKDVPQKSGQSARRIQLTAPTGAEPPVHVEASAEGFADLDQTLSWDALSASKFELSLALDRYLTIEPADATVTRDGKTVLLDEEGRLKLSQLPANGSVNLTIEHPGFQKLEETYDGDQLADLGYKIALERAPRWQLPAKLAEVPNTERLAAWDDLPQRAVASALNYEGQSLEFVLITPGEFVYGAAQADLQMGELSQTTAKIDTPYYISLTEVSHGQLAAWAILPGIQAEPVATVDPSGARLPAVNVSWGQAQKFCAWLGGRLPTEIEWERAARGTDGRPWPWGTADDTAERANLKPVEGGGQVRDVNTFPDSASPDGLLNCVGNAAEWCQDKYLPGHLEDASSPGVAEELPVIRGGSIKDPPQNARVTMRANSSPEGSDDIGFRSVIPVERQ